MSEVSSNTIQNNANCCVFNFLPRSEDGKHLMGFQSETSQFKFPRRIVEGALENKESSYVSLIPHLLAVGRPC